ncbi:MAG: SagB family peptide dehydrogenase [Gemmatimonadaceae bacterium]
MTSNVGIRRSRFLVTYWQNATHLAYNYLTRTSRPCSALIVAILDATGQWTNRESVRCAVSQWEGSVIDQTIDELIRDGAIDTADRPPLPAESALAAWESWNPVAGFFHAATQPVSFDAADVSGGTARFLVGRDFPSPLKQYQDLPRLELPGFSATGQLADVLRSRRTWCEFGEGHVTLNEVATLLGLTFGVQRWVEVGDDQWVALKSSPSGGARHSIEAYVLALGIEGLKNGTYHYCPDSHALTLLASPASKELLAGFVPNQRWFHDPAVFVVMTSVFARMQYKYPHPHAYRVVLLDAGHLSQTFALAATSLGLAPFCVAALNSTVIEQHLEIDGVSESVVHAVGVGRKPVGKEWAPMPDGAANPRTAAPAWATRSPAPTSP